MSGPPSMNVRMSRGVAWMVFFKVVERAISLVSTIILARLLVPADFGIIVLATAMIALLELLGAFGLDVALIRQSDARREHFDAVWTFQALFGIAVAIVAGCLAPLAASLYDDPRLAPIMLVLALARAVGGFESTGVVHFRRDLQFGREVAFLLAKRLFTSVLVTIPLAIVLRNYWALVIGNLAGTCIAVALSYVAHPYRPRFALKGLAQLMHFSKWLLLSSLMEFLHRRVADFIIGRWSGAAALGSFTVAMEIARLPTGEVAAPVHRAVFPGYARLAGDRVLLRRAYVRVTSLLMLIVVPAGAGLCVLAQPAVLILLGPQWQGAVILVQLLAVNAILTVLVSTTHHVNLATGMSRSTSALLAAHVAISLPLMAWLVPSQGAVAAAGALLVASAITAPANFHLLGKAIEFSSRDVLAMLWRPVAGTLVMCGALVWLRATLSWPSTVARQIGYAGVLMLFGALVYACTVMACWAARRDPDSAESWLIAKARVIVGATLAHLPLRYR
jgi:O-antigen/teichoic acid export membrane protein